MTVDKDPPPEAFIPSQVLETIRSLWSQFQTTRLKSKRSPIVLVQPTADRNIPEEKLARRAFIQTPPKQDTTSTLYSKIVEYFQAYRDTSAYFAPYTSLIGPSGIGKSYQIGQLAHQDHAYVVYARLATNDTHHPSRSPVARVFSRPLTQEQMTTLFECYVVAGMVHVKLCRHFRIMPAGFFEMQVDEKFGRFRNCLADYLEGFFDKALQEGARDNKDDDVDSDDYAESVDRLLGWYKQAVCHLFEDAQRTLSKSTICQKFISKKEIRVGDKREPSAIFCFDEARSLFEKTNEESIRHLALKRALKQRCHSKRMRFFALLLDTSCKYHDSSPDEAFPPIYQIDTMDMYVEDCHRSYHPKNLCSKTPQKQEATLKYLYSYGRPLWGAYLKTGEFSSSGLLSIIQSKLFPRGVLKGIIDPTDAIALLSYRIDFHVTLYSLAQTLTSDNLRYIVDTNEKRTLLHTMQPSEPALACAAAAQMLSHPYIRLSAIQALRDNVSKGFISLEDVAVDVAALVLMFTFDQAHKLQSPRPIELSQFLAALFPKSVIEQVLIRIEDSKRIRRVWEEGYVFLTHFVRLSEIPNEATLIDAYRRSAGLILPDCNGCDLAIPVCVRDKMTYLAVRVDNRRGSIMVEKLKGDARESLRLRTSELPKRPHFGLYMSLRAKDQGHAVEIVCPEPVSFRSTGRFKINKEYQWDETKRVVVAAVGFGLETYPGIAFEDGPRGTKETEQIVTLLRNLLNQTVEGIEDDAGFYDNLNPLG